MFVEYPPYVHVFPSGSRLSNVNVTPFSQNISWPARHSGHARHESTMQPTPTRSPSRKRDALVPWDTTRPTISWPGTTGKWVVPQSSFTLCTSLWQMPQWRISIATSWGPGSRRSMDMRATGPLAARTPYAGVFLVMVRGNRSRVSRLRSPPDAIHADAERDAPLLMGETAQSRLIVVATSARLPSGSDSVHQAGAYLSVTRRPPAAIAAAIRTWAWSGGAQMSRWIRLTCGSGASIFWNQMAAPRPRGSTRSSGLSSRSWYASTARQNGFTLGMSNASIVTRTVCTVAGSAGTPSFRAIAEIFRASSRSRSLSP